MNNEKSWFALAINVAAEAAEAVEFALNELGALGTEINHLGVRQAPLLTVVGYFNEPPLDETVQIKLSESLRIYGLAAESVKRIEQRAVENADWLAEWKKHWKPTETDRFIVAPTWETVEDTSKIVVRIEPQMAFGTGTHETTRLCLRAIETRCQPGESFLDVGTGTGILAIAAAKMNSRFKVRGSKLTAYDTDADSIANAEENAALNDASGAIEFSVGSISASDDEHDFVCANITIDVIVPLLSLLLAKSKRILILSGILREQQDLIVGELKKRGVENPPVEFLGEWISVTVEKINA